MADNNTVILRVQLSEEDTEKRLAELAIKLTDTRKASTELTKAYNAGKVSADEFGQQSVKLNGELRATQTEQRNLTKTLDAYRAAQNAQAGSYEQAQKQLDVANLQFQKTAGSQDLSTESAKVLSATIAELRGQLTQTDAANQLFVRSVGQYPKGESLAPLVAQLVKLEEVQKAGILTGKDAADVDRAVVGFKQQIAQAGAQEGKSYEETTSFVKEYGNAIRPATTALVQLEKEQQNVAEGSEAFNQIGFKIAGASKQIQAVPTEVKGVTDTITELDSVTGAFGGQVANLKQQFTAAKQGIELARGGFTGLKGAIAGTGIGLLILALGALYEYFTKTDEGAEDLAAAMAFLKGAFSAVESVVIGVGKGLVKVFTDPKEAAKDLLGFIEDQVVNRVKAIGVIFNALKSGDFKEATNGVLQYATGVENVIGKTKAFATEAKRAADAAYEISRANDALEDSERNSLKTLAENKNLIDKLVLSAKDRTLSEQQRLANLDKAGALEKQNLQTSTAIANERLRIATLENDEAERSGKTSDELRDKVAQAQAAVINLAGESASLQQSIQNRRSALLQQEAADDKTASDKALAAAKKAEELKLKLRRDTLTLENQLLDRQLQQVQVNSDEELSILQTKLRNSYLIELAQQNLTLQQKRLLQLKYEDDSQKLLLDNIKARALAGYDAELASVNAELTLVRKGTDEETELRREAIDTQLKKELAALDKRKDNAAQENLLRANAAKATNDLNYSAALTKLDAFLKAQRGALDESYAKAAISEKQYSDAVIISDQLAAGSRLQLAREFKQDTVALEQQAATAKIAALKKVGDVEREEQAQRMAQTQALAEGLTSLFAETVATTGATLDDFARKSLILIIDSIEKSIIAAQIKIIADSLASADSIASYGILGLAKSAAIIAIVVGATETLKSQLQPKQVFADGTVLGGASHANGGVQLYSRTGHHFGEAEKDEVILTKGVWQNPLLRPVASALNVMGGGRPLLPNFPTPHMAAGGVSQPLVLDQLRGSAGLGIDYKQLGRALADELRRNPPVNKWSHFESAQKQEAQRVSRTSR